jgi:hypothetical protein
VATFQAYHERKYTVILFKSKIKMFSLSKWILCLPNQAQTEPKPLVKLFCVPQVHKTVRLQAHENGNLRHTFLSPRNSSNHSRLPPPLPIAGRSRCVDLHIPFSPAEWHLRGAALCAVVCKCAACVLEKENTNERRYAGSQQCNLPH